MYTRRFIPQNISARLLPTHRGRSKRLNARHLLHVEKKNLFNLFIAFNSAPVSTHLSLKIAAFLKPLPLILWKKPYSPAKKKKDLICFVLFLTKEGDLARPQHYTHPGLAASDGSGADGARLLVPTENFGDAAVGNPQLPGDHAGPDAVVSHLHDFMTDVVG